MRNLLAVVLVLVVIAAAVGWYYGWYHVQTGPAGSGRENVEIEINKRKAETDIKQGEQDVRHAFNQTTARLHGGNAGTTQTSGVTIRERSTGR